MDRYAWLAERRSAVVAVYDDLAPAYDEHQYPSELQREWVDRQEGQADRLDRRRGLAVEIKGELSPEHSAGQSRRSSGSARSRPSW
jgi:hypothetical protein